MIMPGLSISLVGLLFGLTFNAYACLVPLYSAGQTPMSCESSPDEPAHDYCDIFKTFCVEHADHHLPWLDVPTSSLDETIAVTVPYTPVSTAFVRFHDNLAPPVSEVLAKLAILRL